MFFFSAQQKQLLINTLTKVLSLSQVDSVSMLQRLSNLLYQQVSIGKVHISGKFESLLPHSKTVYYGLLLANFYTKMEPFRSLSRRIQTWKSDFSKHYV